MVNVSAARSNTAVHARFAAILMTRLYRAERAVELRPLHASPTRLYTSAKHMLSSGSYRIDLEEAGAR